MKHVLVIVIALSIIIMMVVMGCGKIAEPIDKGLPEIQKIEQRWLDGIKVANSTPRIGLSSQVNNLQAIKRDLYSVEVSSCLSEAKSALTRHMDLTIDGFIAFLGRDESKSVDLIMKGESQLSAYREARDKCDKGTEVVNVKNKSLILVSCQKVYENLILAFIEPFILSKNEYGGKTISETHWPEDDKDKSISYYDSKGHVAKKEIFYTKDYTRKNRTVKAVDYYDSTGVRTKSEWFDADKSKTISYYYSDRIKTEIYDQSGILLDSHEF